MRTFVTLALFGFVFVEAAIFERGDRRRYDPNYQETYIREQGGDSIEFECLSEKYRIYELESLVHATCDIPPSAIPVADCSKTKSQKVRIPTQPNRVDVRLFLGTPRKDKYGYGCDIFRVAIVSRDSSYEDYDEDEYNRSMEEWRTRELIERRIYDEEDVARVVGAGIFNMKRPVLHSSINELKETKDRLKPSDVLELNMGDIVIEGGVLPDSASTISSFITIIIVLLFMIMYL